MEQADLIRLSKTAHACEGFENVANFFHYRSNRYLHSINIDLKPKPKTVWNNIRYLKVKDFGVRVLTEATLGISHRGIRMPGF